MADFLLSVGVDVGLSYEQMKKDISNLVSDLNKTPPKIKVAFDIDQEAVESLRNQITTISKQLGSASTNTSSGSSRQKATAEIADIANEARRAADTQAAASKKAANAEKEHETSLRQVLNTYRELLAAMRTNQNAQVASTYSELVKQTDLFGSALEIAEDKAISIDAALKQVGLDGSTAIENAKTALAAFRVEMEQTGSSSTINMSQMYSVIAQMQNLLNSNANAANLSSYAVLQEQVRLFTDALQLASSGSISLSEALKQVGLDGSTAIRGARTAMVAFRAEVAGATFEEVKLTKGSEQYNAALNKVNTLLAAVRSNTEKWTAAKNGNSSKDYQIYSQQADALEKLSRELQNGEMSAREFNKQFSEIKTTTVQSSAAIRAAGENTQTFSEKIGRLSSKFGTWFSITRVIMAAFRSVKQMVSAVIELDTAMTELKKVTDETDATYEKFLVNAASRAKQLGAALSDTVTATADFARLGFSTEEAEKLADTAIVYKNVGDGIKDISEASESIIATMQAYSDEINPEDVMLIVDKFNEVGNKYAISSEGVGEALLRSAAAMNAANNSLDETIALATAANTIVQDPEKVGTTLKTVSMYLRAAKTEMEEAGEATDGMATSVSELRKDILALTNNKVDIQIDEDTFKSTYQILKELSAEWDNLTDITKANILEMVGGKRNSNVVAALLDNFTVAENALETSANAAGSALAENEKYLDSIQGRISIFKASFEEFSNNLISSGIVKIFVSAGTALMNALNTLVKIHALLPTIVGTLIIIKGIGLSKTIAESSAKVATLSASLVAEKAATTELASSVAMLTLQEKQRLALNIQNAVASGQITAQEGAQILSTLGLATAEGTLTVANKTLGASFKSLMASIPVWGWIALAISAVLEIIVAIVSAISGSDGMNESVESLKLELNQLREEAINTAKSFRELKDSTEDIIPRFVELVRGVNDFGENVSLTDEQYAEFVELNNKIAEMFPEINMGMDENGNAMLALSYSADTLTNSLNALVEAQRKAAYASIAETLPDTLKTITKLDKEYEKQRENIEEHISYLKSVYKGLSSGNTRFHQEWTRTGTTSSGANYYNRYGVLDELGVSRNETMTGAGNGYNSGSQTVTFSFDPDAMALAYENSLTALEHKIRAINDERAAQWRQLNPILNAWMNTDVFYNELNDRMQFIAENMVKGLDFQKLGLDTEEKIQNYISDNIIKPLFNSGADVKEAFAKITDWQDAVKSGKMSEEDFKKNVQEVFNSLVESMKPEKADAFKKAFVEGFNKVGSSGKDFGSVVRWVADQWGNFKIAGDNAIDVVKSFKSELSDLNDRVSALGQLDKIYADIINGGDFDYSALISDDFAEKFRDCEEAYHAFIEQVANSPTDIQACQSAFDNLVTVYLRQSGILDNLTDETRNVTIAMLEQMGVANAAAIVDAELAYQKERLKYTTGEYADMTYEEILQLYNECEAGSTTQQILAELAIAKMQVNDEQINSSNDIDQLIALANTANATSASLANLARAKSLMAQAEAFEAKKAELIAAGADPRGISAVSANAYNYRRWAEEAAKSPLEYDTINSSRFKASYSGGASTRSSQSSAAKSSGSSSGSKKEETWFEKQYKLHKHLVAMEQETDEDYYKWLNLAMHQAYNEGILELDDFGKYQEEVFNGLRALFKDYLNDVEHEIKMRENYDGESKKIISLYKTLISKVEAEIAAARKQGLTNEDDYIQELQDKWQSYNKAIKDIQKDITDAAKDALNDLVDYRVNMFKKDIDNEKDALDKKLDYLKEFYDKQKEMLQDQYDEEEYLKEQSEKRKSVSDIQAQLAQLEFDDSAWAQKRKAELQKELADAQDELDSFEKQHALDAALDAIEESYNAQEEQLQKQIDALDAELNDPELMFNKALAAIQENTGNLYEQMLEYNRKYGSGNDDDVKDVYEEAYKALLKYRELYGKDYDGVSLSNKTGYTPNTSWDGASVSQPNTPSPPQQSSSPSTTTTSSGNSSPELYEGATVTVKDSATNFSDRSHNAYMASFVPGGEFTAYQIRGDEVLIGRNGAYTGWINKSDIVGYASGTKNATPGIHRVDEVAPETIFQSKDGSRYKLFTGGEKVLNAKASNFLYDFANQGGSLLKDGIYNTILSAISSGLFDAVRSSICKNEINLGDIIVQGNADKQTVSEIRREQRSAVEYMLKELNKLNK